MHIENINPALIERRSMEIIENEIGDCTRFSEKEKLVVKRVIHTTADFEYADILRFSKNACELALEAFKKKPVLVTDTQMALSGISKPAVKALGLELYCFMADSDVAETARERGCTRAAASVEKAAELFKDRPLFFVTGNAPTALIRIADLTKEGKISPEFVIGAPVGFVNVVFAKEYIMSLDVPYIVPAGRKGGSTVAAAICNALLYQVYNRDTGKKILL